MSKKAFNTGLVDMAGKGAVPIEVHLLKLIDHPNIIKFENVFQNRDYFQMVRESRLCFSYSQG